MGRESIDFNGGMVHGMVGELLGMPSISPVMKLDIDGQNAKLAREIEGGKEYLELSLPFVAGCQEPIAEWKIPNMRGIMTARTKKLDVREPVDADKKSELEQYKMPEPKGAVKMVEPDNMTELVNLLKTEAKVF
jgi:electron transfer flavoprotein beta subunit